MNSNPILAEYTSLFNDLGPDVTVVTATRRLARWLQYVHGDWWESQGHRAWERPSILPWSAWLADWWEQARLLRGVELPRLLSPAETAALWEQVVARGAGHDLLRPDGAARQAQVARETMLGWRITPQQIAAVAGDDARAFLAWDADFRRRLEAGGWIDAAGLWGEAARALAQEAVGVPRRLILTGFDQMSPAQARLVEALQAVGCSVTQWSPPPLEGRAEQVPAADADDELRRFAAWARDIVSRSPAARIALVVPDLSGRREHIERRLGDLLAPLADLPWREEEAGRPWHLSLGCPLSDYPLVDDALRVLSLAEPERSVPDWGLLLRSPFLSGATESLARAELEAALRRRGALRVSPRTVARLAEARTPDFAATLGRLDCAMGEEGGGRALPSRWAHRFSGWLALAGWPGERALNSAEHQTLAAFHDLLSELARLDAVEDTLSRGEALALLRRLARRQIFQPAGDEAAPIQVMGLLEAAGMRFDALWVLGVDDETWPAPGDPAPLLPAGLQRRHGVPEADPAAGLALAETVAARLRAAAPESRWSWPRRDGERELRASPLVKAMSTVDGETASAETWASVLLAAGVTEACADHVGLPLQPGTTAPGGAAFFRDQAACPFRGYARHRLAAEPLEAGRLGLDARERGQLLHRALELVWRGLDERAALDRLAPEALGQRVAAAVDTAVAELGARREDAFSPRFAELERGRLCALIEEWLDVERRRPPFRVHATEQGCEVEIGGLRFRTRLDRIDELPDGSHVIIDYKTGRPSPNQLGGDERPDDLQLALYARRHDTPVAAVLFGRVRPGECGFVGVARSRGLVPGAQDPARLVPGVEAASWDELEAFWDRALAALAGEGLNGTATVAPKPRACDWCPLPGLCHIHEAGSDDD